MKALVIMIIRRLYTAYALRACLAQEEAVAQLTAANTVNNTVAPPLLAPLPTEVQ